MKKRRDEGRNILVWFVDDVPKNETFAGVFDASDKCSPT